MINVREIREDFPVLQQEVYNRPLIYLDNSSTTQVPTQVTDRIVEHYRRSNGHVRSKMHFLGISSANAFDKARKKVATFINAPSKDCVVFTRSATEALNTIAGGLRARVKTGDLLLSTMLEHPSNYVPWQQLALEHDARFETVGVGENGDLDIDDLDRLLALEPKVLAVTCCSDVMGSVTPLGRIVERAHAAGALVVADATQLMRHAPIDVQELDVDFLAFSGQTMLAGTGIGVLYGRPEALELLGPCEFGSAMVDKVEKEQTNFAELPQRLEAGAPNYVGAIALATAMDYLDKVGRTEIAAYEDELVSYAQEGISSLDHVNVLGNPEKRSCCVPFNVDGVHHFDLCALVDKRGLALGTADGRVRPLLSESDQMGAALLCPAFYNTKEEIDSAIGCIARGAGTLRTGRAH